MTRKGQILRVWTEVKPDCDPDLSFLGEYTDTAKDGAIERENVNSREYHYFVPAMTGEDTGNPDSPRQDFDRMEDYNRGGWCMIGIIAKAEIQLAKSSIIQTLRSGGLWGIESDSGSYLDEVRTEELANLRDELTSVGFSKRQIDRAFAKVEHKD